MALIWHNPRCSKSRQTLALLEARGVAPKVRLYLQDPPGADELQGVLDALGLAPSGLIRKGESLFRDLGLNGASEADLLAAMAGNPILIERPVVLTEKGARLGRPPEAVLEIL